MFGVGFEPESVLAPTVTNWCSEGDWILAIHTIEEKI